MSSAAPHPTQVRLACERCRKQKLRCQRQPGASHCAPCVRCARLNFTCEAGSQRKIGRPGKGAAPQPVPAPVPVPQPRREAVVPVTLPSPSDAFSEGSTISVDVSSNGSTIRPPIMQPSHAQIETPPEDVVGWDGIFGDALLGDPNSMMMMSFDSPSRFFSPTLPAFGTSKPIMTYTGPSKPYAAVSEMCFEALSRVNSTFRSLMSRLAMPEAEGPCSAPSLEGLPNIEIFQISLKAVQDYLTTLKTIHRAVGMKKSRNHMPGSAQAWDLPLDPAATDAEGKQPSLDTATTLMIISCYVQMVQVFEKFLKVFDTFFRLTLGETMVQEDISFSGVPITDFTSQVVMFAELFRHVLQQINVVLGMPGVWSGRTVWTGLLTKEKDRELLGRELGASPYGDWSERPRRMMAAIDQFKNLMEESSMLTQF